MIGQVNLIIWQIVFTKFELYQTKKYPFFAYTAFTNIKDIYF